ncbi:hypothetical protein JCM6882_004703 [Rhodosporidiobolus microsporus]
MHSVPAVHRRRVAVSSPEPQVRPIGELQNDFIQKANLKLPLLAQGFASRFMAWSSKGRAIPAILHEDIAFRTENLESWASWAITWEGGKGSEDDPYRIVCPAYKVSLVWRRVEDHGELSLPSPDYACQEAPPQSQSDPGDALKTAMKKTEDDDPLWTLTAALRAEDQVDASQSIRWRFLLSRGRETYRNVHFRISYSIHRRKDLDEPRLRQRHLPILPSPHQSSTADYVIKGPLQPKYVWPPPPTPTAPLLHPVQHWNSLAPYTPGRRAKEERARVRKSQPMASWS